MAPPLQTGCGRTKEHTPAGPTSLASIDPGETAHPAEASRKLRHGPLVPPLADADDTMPAAEPHKHGTRRSCARPFRPTGTTDLAAEPPRAGGDDSPSDGPRLRRPDAGQPARFRPARTDGGAAEGRLARVAGGAEVRGQDGLAGQRQGHGEVRE
ncbi:hypothetical protein TruAng_005666 [Truncatella angustata]|nr:hypothetical protein TruAng_005666 [Truncatella angustata]